MYKLMNVDKLAKMMEATHVEFAEDIEKQNKMYRLPINDVPTLDKLTKPNGAREAASTRITGFLKTLSDEISEGKDILEFLHAIEEGAGISEHSFVTLDPKMLPKAQELFDLSRANPEEAKKQVLVDIADWLADMVVYIRSEAMKFGIPLEAVQQVVMASNFSKLPSDGIPVHDENGKFLKDMTNYVPPEDAIYTLLFDPNLEAEEEFDDE